jgi:hypothetical protein
MQLELLCQVFWLLMMVANMLEKKMWSKKKTSLRQCGNVVRIAMPIVLGFDDGSHHVGKKKMWSKLQC